MRDPRHVLITGASSGIGEALALAYAQPGVSLSLIGRNAGRLDRVTQSCRDRGADVASATRDVTDAAALSSWLQDTDRRKPIDLAIANAGISAQSGGRGETEEQARRIFAINVDGVMNTVMPLIAPMTARGRGQIAIVSSLASFHAFPGSAAYCASKAAVRFWGEALRAELAPKRVEVSVICPGFITTPMTATNDFFMPLLMPADRAGTHRVSLAHVCRGEAAGGTAARTHGMGGRPPAASPALIARRVASIAWAEVCPELSCIAAGRIPVRNTAGSL
jgi:short-subunit dehydrogenase